MRTLQILGNSPEAIKFFEDALSLPFIREKKASQGVVKPVPPCQYTTVEEFRAAVFEGMEACRRGDVISQEELEKEIDTWQ